MNTPATNLKPKGPRVLVVEDEEILRSAISTGLVSGGFRPLLAPSPAEGFRRAMTEHPDLVLLDWMMPGETGDSLCRRLRAHGITCPIVMLTSLSDESSQVSALNGGADDYWVKPLATKVMIARINALLRRQTRSDLAATVFEGGDLRIDLGHREVLRAGAKVDLGIKEMGILEVLILADGGPVSREQLLTSVWHYNSAPDTRTVDNYIMALRRKLEPDPIQPIYIVTARGAGYRFDLERFQPVPGVSSKA